MSDNARIEHLADGVNSEVIAEQTHMFYDVNTGTAMIAFQARKYLFVGGVAQAPMGDYDVLPAQLADIGQRCFAPEGTLDPVTGADLSKVSSVGLMQIMKIAYDVLYGERASATAAALAELAAHAEAYSATGQQEPATGSTGS